MKVSRSNGFFRSESISLDILLIFYLEKMFLLEMCRDIQLFREMRSPTKGSLASSSCGQARGHSELFQTPSVFIKFESC